MRKPEQNTIDGIGTWPHKKTRSCGKWKTNQTPQPDEKRYEWPRQYWAETRRLRPDSRLCTMREIRKVHGIAGKKNTTGKPETARWRRRRKHNGN